MSSDTTKVPEQTATPQPQSAAADMQAALLEKPAEPTAGERAWWNLNYIGVGYLTNLAVSVVIWDSLMHGHLNPIFKKVQGGIKNVLMKSGMEAAKAEKNAYTITKMGSSPIGGHFTVLGGNAYLEAHSAQMTHNLNKKLDPDYKYKDLTLPENARDDEYPQLANPPNHNSMRQMGMRRGIGWVAVTLAGLGLNKIGLETPLENGTVRFINGVIQKSGIEPLKRLSQVPDGRFQRYTKLVALDMYFTVITSAIIAMTKNSFGKPRGTGPEPEEALSLDIPGLTDEDDNRQAARPRTTVTPTHITGRSALPAPSNPLIVNETLLGGIKNERAPSEPQHYLPA